MFITAVNFAKKPKNRIIMILMESISSGHKRTGFRDKSAERKELIAFDPYVQLMSLYREVKKIRTMRGKFNLKEDYNTPKFDDKGNLIDQSNLKKRPIPTLNDSNLNSFS